MVIVAPSKFARTVIAWKVVAPVMLYAIVIVVVVYVDVLAETDVIVEPEFVMMLCAPSTVQFVN